MNGGIGYFLNYFLSYLFSFYPACSLQFILQWCAWLLSSHSSRRCFPLFGAVSWNWERLLGWYGSFFLPLTLFSSTEMFLVFFSSCPGSVVIIWVSEITYASWCSDHPLPRPGFLAWNQNPKISRSSILIKHIHLDSSSDSINPLFKHSQWDFYLSHIHIF